MYSFAHFLKVQVSGIRYIHTVAQLLPPSASRIFPSSQTGRLHLLNNNFPFLFLWPWYLYFIFCLHNLSTQGTQVSAVIQYLSFCVWLISFSIVSSSFIHIIADF